MLQVLTQRTGASPPRGGESARRHGAGSQTMRRSGGARRVRDLPYPSTRHRDGALPYCLSACKACWDRWVRTRLEREGAAARVAQSATRWWPAGPTRAVPALGDASPLGGALAVLIVDTWVGLGAEQLG